MDHLNPEEQFVDDVQSVATDDDDNSSVSVIEHRFDVDTDADIDLDDSSSTVCGSIFPSLFSLFRRLSRSFNRQHQPAADRHRHQRHMASFSSSGCSGSDSEGRSSSCSRSPRSTSRKEAKVKNIYRRPLSRTSTRLRTYSCSRCQPPVCGIPSDSRRHASCSISGQAAEYPESLHQTDIIDDVTATSCEPRRRTIDTVRSSVDDPNNVQDLPNLETRRRSCSMPPLLQSILKRHRNPARKAIADAKQASFQDQVDVHYFDQDSGERRNEIPKRGAFGEMVTSPKENKNIINSNPSSCSGTISWGGRESVEVGTQIPRWVSRGEEPVCNVEGRIVLSIDSHGNRGRRLLVTIETKGNFDRSRTSVKCVSNGTALKICLQPDEAKTEGEKQQQQQQQSPQPVIKHLPLPVTIDPFNVKARLHEDGTFILLAPVMDL